MKISIRKLRRISEHLQEIIDEADNHEVTEVSASPNTYGLNEFIACGSDGFLDLNADIDDLLEEDDC